MSLDIIPSPQNTFVSRSLHSLKVRPVFAEERNAWDTLMATHHYLGFRAIVGESIRYVAVQDDQWVALLGWGAAAFKSRHRDTLIGWNEGLKWQRLHLIANNVRFLILPDIHIPNLASKTLSLNLKRLSDDWQAFYGHPILMAETFVDHSRFKGTCYKAAGFIPLGETRGFRRNGGKYFLHGNPKTIFIRALGSDALSLLKDPVPHRGIHTKEAFVNVDTLPISGSGGLIEYLKTIPDPRSKRGIRHNKVSILAVAVCAVLSGSKSFAAIGEWALNCSQNMLKRLSCRRDPETKRYLPPSEPTIRRLLQEIDAGAADRAVNNWLYALARPSDQQAIAIDGKTLKGAKDKNGKQKHLLSIFLHQQKAVIGQDAVDTKSNEIPALPSLLKDMNVEGMMVTADALHAQKKTATFLVEDKKADYCFVIKDNQSTLKNDIESLNMGDSPPHCETVDKGHGRIEIRRIWCSSELNGYIEFPHHKQVFRIERETTNLVGENIRHEVVSGITSRSPERATPENLLEFNRGHWSIENSLHWVRDVTFDEDRSQIRTKSGPQVMSTLRNLAISIFRIAKNKNIAKALRYYAAKPHLALPLIGL